MREARSAREFAPLSPSDAVMLVCVLEHAKVSSEPKFFLEYDSDFQKDFPVRSLCEREGVVLCRNVAELLGKLTIN